MLTYRHPSRDWHVHIGAHKTATTHLQDMLAALRHRIPEEDVKILVPDTIRDRIESVLSGPLASGGFQKNPRRALAGLNLRRRVKPVLGSGRRIVLSEENIIGIPVELLTSHGCYPLLERRLKTLSALFGPKDTVTLYLSVRSFDRVLPGAYATALRFLSPRPRPMEAVRADLRNAPPKWTDIVTRIRRSVPSATLRVWRQEDYGKNPRPVIETLLDRSLANLPHIARPVCTLTPSAAGIARAEAAIAEGLLPERHRDAIEAIYTAHSASAENPRYMPFNADEQRMLQEQYAHDINQIRNQFPNMLIDGS